ncbi:TatD family hydrolase, partial [Parabacteroides sp. OttesenSCG-928-G06]|nr:TatD family hydrolase [Parabacteroides sp. OttesenSCG-928-G06]
THKPAESPDEIAIVNTIIREGEVELATPYKSYGIHPWYVEDVEKQMEQLRRCLARPESVALGEAGLDKLAITDWALQESVFCRQIMWSEELRKPLIIHCVKAWPELIALKRRYNPVMPWIIHGFRGKKELAAELVSHGFYLSFGAHFQPEALQAAWPSRLFAETDEVEVSIREVYQQIAGELRLPVDVVISRLAENIESVFISL